MPAAALLRGSSTLALFALIAGCGSAAPVARAAATAPPSSSAAGPAPPSSSPVAPSAPEPAAGDAPDAHADGDSVPLAAPLSPFGAPLVGPLAPGAPASDPRASARATEEVIRSLRPAFRRCFDAGLRDDPGFGRAVRIRVDLDGDGRAKRVRAEPTPAPAFEACVARAFAGRTLPSANGSLVIPFNEAPAR